MKDQQQSAGKNKPKPPFQFNGRFLMWYVIVSFLMLWVWQDVFEKAATTTIPYSEFKQHVAAGRVVECDVRQTDILGVLELPETSDVADSDQSAAGETEQDRSSNSTAVADRKSTRQFFRTIRVDDPKLVEQLDAAGVKFSGVRPSFLQQFFTGWILPLAIIALIWMFIIRRMAASGPAIMNVGKSRAKLIGEKETGVSFADVAGCDEAKAELEEVVDFLKNPMKYESVGAKIPKGVLLVGPPGTGKTLMAKAVAGEAGVPFFLLSGSDFVEMFVGVGAARVRDLFEQAKNQAPCIVFIDELDAIGRERGVHVGVGHDEREQTLNQLLVELDGFKTNTGVILLAASNRPEVLDKALLRPGRFDRQVVVDAPDLEGRLAVLKVHARGRRLADSADLKKIAQATPGFSGADLANAINEAALMAARRGEAIITQHDLEEAVEKVVAGPERRSRRLNEDEKRRVAYHETGHALVAAFSDHADPVHKISIIPRGKAALGYTMQLPADQQFLATRSELFDRLKGLLGGRAAEELVFGEVSSGAENDLERATELARRMVCMFGMGESVGLMHCQRRSSQFLPTSEGNVRRDCSEDTARRVDEEVRALLDQAYADAKNILETRAEELEAVTQELLKHETLDAAQFNQLLRISARPLRETESSAVAPARCEVS